MNILLVELESHYDHITQLKAELHRVFGMQVTLHHALLHVPQEIFITDRQKWDAEKIIGYLHGRFNSAEGGKFMVLAIFPYDLFANGLNFVYGLGERGGNFAVMSQFRLDENYYGRRRGEKKVRERTLKEAMHEIGHLAGIEHCPNKKCVMTFSPHILFVDRKKAEFCARCQLFL